MVWLWLPVAAPLLLAPLWGGPRALRRVAEVLTPFIALPALALAWLTPSAGPTRVDWLLLGTWLGVDALGRVFLLLTALLWTCAGIYARGYMRGDPCSPRFHAFFLVAMAGNLGLCVAHDAITFYSAFAVMTFAGYGLVAHPVTAESHRAASVYLVMAVLAEALLVVAFLWGTLAAGGDPSFASLHLAVPGLPMRGVWVAFVLVGFGVKAGAVPLHMWLPLAHPVAPTPASAVLSGCMIKAGLLGWLRFLPLGTMELPTWGATVLGLGLGAAFYGVVFGLLQSEPKTVLAYSSISQMGLMNAAVGIALAAPALWPVAQGAIAVFVLHHGLAKGALFLGVGMSGAQGRLAMRLRWVGLLLPALAIAGFPGTSGFVAKEALKALSHEAPWGWSGRIEELLIASSIATTLLLGRLLWLTLRAPPRPAPPPSGWQWAGWGALFALVACAAWIVPGEFGLAERPTLDAGKLVEGLWPLGAGALGLWALLRTWPGRTTRPLVGPGDLLVAIERLWQPLKAPVRRLRESVPEYVDRPLHPALARAVWRMGRAEVELTRWRVASLVVVLLTVLVTGLVVLGGER